MAVYNDYAEITKVIERYAEGHRSGIEQMKKAFHPNAIINAEPIQVLFDAIDAAGKTDPDTRIDILDVEGGIACARVVIEKCYGNNYVDFLQLMKTDDGWKIISKIYHQY